METDLVNIQSNGRPKRWPGAGFCVRRRDGVFRWCCWWVALLLVAGCGLKEETARQPSAPPVLAPPVISGEAALAAVREFVELGPKDSGTSGAEQAAQYIFRQLQTRGVTAEIQEFQDSTPDGELTFRNVLGRIPGGAGPIVLLGAHYDTKIGIDGFVGANDSGSGVGLLLELARAFATAEPLPLELRFAFFDGEECRVRYGPNDGFHGSRYLAERMAADGSLSNVTAMIVLDMVGDAHLTVTIPRNSTPWLVSRVFAAARAEDARQHFLLYPYPISDDHEAFFRRGVPAVDLIDFEFGSRPGANDYWHTAADSMDKLSARSLDIVGRVVARMIVDLAATPAPGK